MCQSPDFFTQVIYLELMRICGFLIILFDLLHLKLQLTGFSIFELIGF